MNEQEKEQFRAELERLAGKIYAEVSRQFQEKFHSMKIGGTEAEMPQIPFQTVYAAALMRLAAVLAVDSMIDKAKFGAIADESYDAAYKAAPKFS